MNRWFGDASKSERQATERQQRQAARTIRSQVVPSDSEDEFLDPDTSFSAHLNLDGGGESGDEAGRSTDDDANSAMDAATRAAEMAKPFAKRNLPDDAEAWKKEIKHIMS